MISKINQVYDFEVATELADKSTHYFHYFIDLKIFILQKMLK